MATKKVAPKKSSAKTGAKRTVTKRASARGVNVSVSIAGQEDPMVRVLIVIFAAFSILFALMATWRYGM